MQSHYQENTSSKHYPLHEILRHCKHAVEVKTFLDGFSIDEQVKMAHTVDESGLLPILILEKISLPDDEKNSIFDLIFPLTTKQQCLPLSTEIDGCEFSKMPDSPLRTNLLNAVEIVNLVRRDRLESITHPEISNFTNEERHLLVNKFYFLEKVVNRSAVKLFLSSSDDHFVKSQTEKGLILIKNDDLQAALLALLANLFKEKRIGNCHELAVLGLYYWVALEKPDTCGVFISNGDHVFMIIGEGKNAVICDPWSGLVCLKSEMEHKLKNYAAIPIARNSKTARFYNVLINFNPHYHTLSKLSFSQVGINILESISFAKKYNFSLSFYRASLKARAVFQFILPKIMKALDRKIICENHIHSLKKSTYYLINCFWK